MRDHDGRYRILLYLLVTASALPWAAPLAVGGVAVTATYVEDNGDGDSYADTQETVALRVVLLNTSDEDLTGVTARLSTSTPGRACVTDDTVEVGSLLAGEERLTTEAFTFVVPPDVNRSTLEEDLSVVFVVSVFADQSAELAQRQWITLDLDLDVAGGSDPTAFYEGFEHASGFGQFTEMHLDFGLYDDDTTDGGPADGYRCQYFYQICGSCGTPPECSPGASAPHADTFFWQLDGPGALDGGRAWDGARSLYMGITLPGGGHTTPTAILEAVRTEAPIHLGWERICSVTRTTTCADDTDCPMPEQCVAPSPSLRIRQQVNLVDSRTLTMTPGEAVDRAVVQAQLADASGGPIGSWFNLAPRVNLYDQQATDDFTNCMFDPIDDGSDENDWFAGEGSAGHRPHGPSSTCNPEYVFAALGDTTVPFDPANVGGASDGPGLAGSHGTGTWVESRFDLGRLRGRSVRLRFLNGGLSLSTLEDWEALLGPNDGDDGWWVDGVEITDAIAVGATAAVDTKDNSALPFVLPDGDGDAIFDPCDNCVIDPNTGQDDADADTVGDICDVCQLDPDDDADGDSICLPLDNCPFVVNSDQSDGDGDAVGDACDNCGGFNPSQDLDEDADGVPCAVDNCLDDANPAQKDEDLDGVGDACDICPGDPINDDDGDGLCGAVDSCPDAPNPLQGAAIELADGSHRDFVLSPDEQTLVVAGDLIFPGNADENLFAVPAAGGSFVTLFVSGTESDPTYEFTPDGSRVVFRYWSQTAVWSVPIAGGSVTRLNPVESAGIVNDFAVSPDSSRVVYKMDTNPTGFDTELFSVPIAGGVSVRLNGTLVPDGSAGGAVISPDGTRVLYVAEQEIAGRFDLYSVPILGGSPVKLNGTMIPGARVSDYRFTPDGSRVVYLADEQQVDRFELYSVPSAGGTAIKISGTMIPGGSIAEAFDEDAFAITPGGTRVVYIADQDVDVQLELYAVPVVGGPVTKLNGPLVPDGDVFQFELVPGAPKVVYAATQESVFQTELFSAFLTGGGSSQLIDLADNQKVWHEFRISPDGVYVVYPMKLAAGGNPTNLFSVPVGGGASIQLNGPLTGFDGVGSDFRITGDSSRVVYRAPQAPSTTSELYSVPITGGTPVLLTDGQSAESAPFEVTFDGEVTYFDTGTVYASYWDFDPDGDGIHVRCDNCADASNASQQDGDGDGFGTVCDCDDAEPAVRPGADQVCDGLNNDCLDPLWPVVPPDDADADGDGFAICSGDCDDGKSTDYPGAEEVNDGRDNQCPGDAGFGLVDELSGEAGFPDPGNVDLFAWPAQLVATEYEAVRSSGPTFDTDCACFRTTAPEWIDVERPATNGIFHYLARPIAPNAGSFGARSDGAERSGGCLAASCPP